MAGSINKVTLIGNLGRDPAVRLTSAGKKVISFSMATSESWRDKASGELREKAEWHRVVIFNEHLCDVAEKYLRKGSKIYLEGAVQTRRWTDAHATERYTTEIVLGNYRGDIQMLSARDGGSVPANTGEEPVASGSGEGGSAVDDDIPF